MNCRKGLLASLASIWLEMVFAMVIGPIILIVLTHPKKPELLGMTVKYPAKLAVGTNLNDIKNRLIITYYAVKNKVIF